MEKQACIYPFIDILRFDMRWCYSRHLLSLRYLYTCTFRMFLSFIASRVASVYFWDSISSYLNALQHSHSNRISWEQVNVLQVWHWPLSFSGWYHMSLWILLESCWELSPGTAFLGIREAIPCLTGIKYKCPFDVFKDFSPVSKNVEFEP